MGNDSDSVNMLLIEANELWFYIVSCAQSDPDFGSVPEMRSHGADHMCESAYIKHF